MPVLEYQESSDIVIPQGATWREEFTYGYLTDPKDETTFVAIDISDLIPVGQVRASKSKESLKYAEFTFDTTLAAQGLITASMSGYVTGKIPRMGFYDIELHSDLSNPETEEIIRLVQGKAWLDTEVTE